MSSNDNDWFEKLQAAVLVHDAEAAFYNVKKLLIEKELAPLKEFHLEIARNIEKLAADANIHYPKKEIIYRIPDEQSAQGPTWGNVDDILDYFGLSLDVISKNKDGYVLAVRVYRAEPSHHTFGDHKT